MLKHYLWYRREKYLNVHSFVQEHIQPRHQCIAGKILAVYSVESIMIYLFYPITIFDRSQRGSRGRMLVIVDT